MVSMGWNWKNNDCFQTFPSICHWLNKQVVPSQSHTIAVLFWSGHSNKYSNALIPQSHWEIKLQKVNLGSNFISHKNLSVVAICLSPCVCHVRLLIISVEIAWNPFFIAWSHETNTHHNIFNPHNGLHLYLLHFKRFNLTFILLLS